MSHFCVYVFHDKRVGDISNLLSPYDESIKLPPYVAYTREQAIEATRKDIEDFKNSECYMEYSKDPKAYREKWSNNKAHLDYLENEFPKKLKWSDDECYEYMAEDYRLDGMVDKDGNLLSNYNPNSKWDWWVIGGRYSGVLKGKNSMLLSDLNIDDIETPYAFIEPNGNWNQQGQVGWFGISTNEMNYDEWDRQFKDYLKSLSNNKDLAITVVDCHI